MLKVYISGPIAGNNDYVSDFADAEAEYVQSVIKKDEADKLLRLIDKAIKEGAGTREARRLAAWEEDEDA